MTKIIIRPVAAFALVASFSLFFMALFLIVGILTAQIERNVTENNKEAKHFSGYIGVLLGAFVAGSVSIAVMFLV